MPLLLAIADQLDNIRLFQSLDRFDFGCESTSKAFLISQYSRNDLDRNDFSRLVMLPKIDDSHSASTKNRFDFVGAEIFKFQERNAFEKLSETQGSVTIMKFFLSRER
jgi:hypothetical protein